jgi:hypothetical protein
MADYMINITDEHREFFLLNGWVQVSLGLSEAQVKTSHLALLELERKAKDVDYPLGRIYFPYLTDTNKAAIEAPFNKRIMNSGIADLFTEIRLGSAVKSLMNWDDVYCQLARLFTMANHKYRGQWHRDFTGWDGNIITSKTVQIGIYLKNQEGFRVIKKDLDITGKSNARLKTDFEYGSTTLPLKLKGDYYDTIRGEAGTLLFFMPGLLHQGSSCDKRLDFHMRFSNSPKLEKNEAPVEYIRNDFQDFAARDIYAYNADPMLDRVSPSLPIPTLKTRLINTVNYNTGAVNFFRVLKRSITRDSPISEPWSYDLLANTVFQKG